MFQIELRNGIIPTEHSPVIKMCRVVEVVITYLSSAAYVGGGRKSRGGPGDVLGQGHACQR